MKPAAFVGALAAGALALGPVQAGPTRQLPLRAPQKLTVGPLLGFVSGRGPNNGVRLARIDPRTLRATGSRSLRLPLADAWAVAPGGRTLTLAVHRNPVNESNSLSLVTLPSLRWRAGAVRLGADVSGLAWTSAHQVVALVGKFLCCPAPLRVVVVHRSEERRVGKECRSRWSPYH